jgi:hypothetical protein
MKVFQANRIRKQAERERNKRNTNRKEKFQIIPVCQDPKDTNKKHLDLMNTFSRVADSKSIYKN